MMNEVDKAERTQALKAFLIPSGLFVACLFNAAGIYIIYSGNAVGMVFLGIGLTVILAGLFAFITFENKERAKKLKGKRPVSHEPEPYMPPSVKPMRIVSEQPAEVVPPQAPLDSSTVR